MNLQLKDNIELLPGRRELAGKADSQNQGDEILNENRFETLNQQRWFIKLVYDTFQKSKVKDLIQN